MFSKSYQLWNVCPQSLKLLKMFKKRERLLSVDSIVLRGYIELSLKRIHDKKHTKKACTNANELALQHNVHMPTHVHIEREL